MSEDTMSNTQTATPKEKTDLTAAVMKRMLQVVFTMLLQAAILFVSAGRLNWAMAWAYLGVYAGIVAVNAVVILPKNPELIAERGQTKENTKSWDKLLTTLITIPTLVMLIIPGLQVRYEWSPQLGWVVQLVGLVIVALGYGLVSWAMASNPFFSSTVRIQADRGQTVASSGPYRYMRHPGYVGMMIYSFASPLALGSLWALIPAVLVVSGFVVRTALEDKTLQAELDGYKDYAARVRYRLVPGVW
jgi:protein-S-isoprenylcysteine O-methyltransferase Ste14